jgi:uncharacterized protein (TIGR02246 family)
MSDADEVVAAMCRRYESAVSANDAAAYAALFASDAIRMPPGEHGLDQIRAGEQADYDVARWSIRSIPVDALQIAADWVYGIARVEATATAHADGTTSAFRIIKTWLLRREPAGDWRIVRQMWNLQR